MGDRVKYEYRVMALAPVAQSLWGLAQAGASQAPNYAVDASVLGDMLADGWRIVHAVGHEGRLLVLRRRAK